jgi:hypothetical protein
VSSVSISAALDAAAQALAGALATSGTRATFVRPAGPAGPGALDPDTLVVTAAAAGAVIRAGVPVFVLPDTPGGTVESFPGAAGVEDPRWRVIAPPDLIDVGRGVLVTVTESRDARMVGRVWEITTMLDNTAGAARVALARAVPERGQA